MNTALRLLAGPILVGPVLALTLLLGGARPAQATVRDPGPQGYISAVVMHRCPSRLAPTRSWALHPCRSFDLRAYAPATTGQ
jgi:hypothetical protein